MTCQAIKIGDTYGIICMTSGDFDCPVCGERHTEEDYYKKLDRSKKGLIYKPCKNCGEVLGITADMMSNIHAWVKKDEPPMIKL